jgi:hypothetical protein
MESPLDDFYATLNILPSAEEIVVHAAYKALARRYHPDHFQGSKEEANRRMAQINEAYAVLSNFEKRRTYDEARAFQGQANPKDKREGEQPGRAPNTKGWDEMYAAVALKCKAIISIIATSLLAITNIYPIMAHQTINFLRRTLYSLARVLLAILIYLILVLVLVEAVARSTGIQLISGM